MVIGQAKTILDDYVRTAYVDRKDNVRRLAESRLNPAPPHIPSFVVNSSLYDLAMNACRMSVETLL
jgi:hypothetical protein